MAQIMRQKEAIKEQREKEIELKKQMNLRMKTEISSNIQYKRQEKMRQIQEEMRILKLQKQYNMELTKYMKMEEVNSNKSKYETAKGQTMIMEEKKKALEMEKKLKLKLELEKKLLEEFRLKEEADVRN
jgi:hypothetical protein